MSRRVVKMNIAIEVEKWEKSQLSLAKAIQELATAMLKGAIQSSIEAQPHAHTGFMGGDFDRKRGRYVKPCVAYQVYETEQLETLADELDAGDLSDVSGDPVHDYGDQ